MLDTNAVLDLYRFTDATREAYFAALNLLGERLWIPNRVGEEFYDNRARVIAERQSVRATITARAAAPIEALMKVVADTARSHGVDGRTAATAVHDGVLEALDPIVCEIEGTVGAAAIAPGTHPDDDPILARICALFDAKTGAPFTDKDAAKAHQEHSIRWAGHIPPGYRDKKPGDRAAGDYLLWKQTINEARDRNLPVLLITNETKEDWVFIDDGYVMPRVELVREMKTLAGCAFHLIDPPTFLALAKAHLAAEVSDAAVDEAGRVGKAAAPSPPDATVERAVAALPTGVDVAWGLSALAGIDNRTIFGGMDTTSFFTQAVKGIDTGAFLGKAFSGVDTGPSLLTGLSDIATTEAIRQSFAGFSVPPDSYERLEIAPHPVQMPSPGDATPAKPKKKAAAPAAAPDRAPARKNATKKKPRPKGENTR
ncbi:PIN-like domain-containing protein [Nocardia sp. NPDC050435]|uniref:PIN-like domain-containing protein n=1 Tax=Nocardia sp. NPDC050435 TaxID=3155040 RepID=UPI0033F7A3E9